MKFANMITPRYAAILPRLDGNTSQDEADEGSEVLQVNAALTYASTSALASKGLPPPPPVVTPTTRAEGGHLITSFAPFLSTTLQGIALTHHHHAQYFENPVTPPTSVAQITSTDCRTNGNPPAMRLNKFVRRLHDMLVKESKNGVVEWRKGLLVLRNTNKFAKQILPKYFNTRNFKTFRRQLNYYGFVHVRSYAVDVNGNSTSSCSDEDMSPQDVDASSTTTALWVNQELAKHGTDEISSVLLLRRVSPGANVKTAEGRRIRKKEAFCQVEGSLQGVVSIPIATPAVTRLPPPPQAVVPCPLMPVAKPDASSYTFFSPFPNFPNTDVHTVSSDSSSSASSTSGDVHEIPDPTSEVSPPHQVSPDGEAAQLLLMLSHSSPVLSA